MSLNNAHGNLFHAPNSISSNILPCAVLVEQSNQDIVPSLADASSQVPSLVELLHVQKRHHLGCSGISSAADVVCPKAPVHQSLEVPEPGGSLLHYDFLQNAHATRQHGNDRCVLKIKIFCLSSTNMF